MAAFSSRPSIRVGAVTHRGLVRSENQDRISRFRVPQGEVFAIADGMGGHRDGARAAELALAKFEQYLSQVPPDFPTPEALQRAASHANSELYRQACGAVPGAEPQGAAMGSTLVVLLLRGRQVFVGHAGDSRAYLLQAGVLSPLTWDHTLVQRMIDHGMLSVEEARNHPDASVLTRAFGQQAEIELEVGAPFELAPGDRFLLCSDGLCGYVEATEIARVLAAASGAQEATDRLLDLALAKGGEDNISVQVIQVVEFDRSFVHREDHPWRSPRIASEGRNP
jgi:protein phosphatase